MNTLIQAAMMTKMHKFIGKAVTSLCAVFLLHTPASLAETDRRHHTTTQVIYNIYQPAYDQFAKKSQQLSTEIETLCKTKDATQTNAARSAFTETVATFSEIEFYRVGPMIEKNRQNRLFYWPDTRRVGERQLRSLLANSEDFNIKNITQKSVALQGFPALERLLFDNASNAELTTPTNNRCAIAKTVAVNIENLATQLQTAWSDPLGILQQMLAPTDSSELFRSETEVLRSYITQLSAGLEFLITRKLEPLVAEIEINKLKANYKASIRKAPFWRSDNFLTNVKGNIIGLQALLIESGIAAETNLEKELKFEFTLALLHIEKLNSITMLTEDGSTITNDAQDLLLALIIPMASIQLTISDRIAKTLGVSAGFNSDDGD